MFPPVGSQYLAIGYVWRLNPVEKINNIILLEMFRDERARDIALEELFNRQQKVVSKIFTKMQRME